MKEKDIPSPYNFVPVSDKVFFPEWADKVSHDVPFEDGVSGSLDIKITTITPTYIRNTGENQNSFFQLHKNQAMIPGSSLKGMIRNIIEIASFGQMKQVNNHRYSYRNLERSFTRNFDNVRAGWLKRDKNNQWCIQPCKWAKVKQVDLENYHRNENIDLGSDGPGLDKYSIWSDDLDDDLDDNLEIKIDIKCTRAGNKAINLGGGSKTGYVVFTGQPTDRNSSKQAKQNQFIFYDDQNECISATHLKEDFLYIYEVQKLKEREKTKNKKNDNNLNKLSDDWLDYWKEIFEDEEELGEVPVFFILQNNLPVSMGLTRLHKLLYKNTIHNVIPLSHSIKKIDLASVMFGTIHDENALKGRVHVGHLQTETYSEDAFVETVLGTPKASYVPNYLEQSEKNGRLLDKEYKNYDSKGTKIRGWKRYSTKWQSLSKKNLPKPLNDNVKAEFTPIKARTIFNGKIRVHNLKPQELGALIWALTWGQNDTLLHNIGMGKPYGFGNIKIEITACDLKNIHGESQTYQQFSQLFENMMEQEINNWNNSSQILHLKAMANPNFNYTYNHKRYPNLGMDTEPRGPNEFVEYKKRENRRVLKKLY